MLAQGPLPGSCNVPVEQVAFVGSQLALAWVLSVPVPLLLQHMCTVGSVELVLTPVAVRRVFLVARQHNERTCLLPSCRQMHQWVYFRGLKGDCYTCQWHAGLQGSFGGLSALTFVSPWGCRCLDFVHFALHGAAGAQILCAVLHVERHLPALATW